MSARARRPLYGLMGANVVSQTGEAASNVAIPWFVFETTGSIALMGVVAAASAAARVVGSLAGGPVVDRIGFRRSSLLADVLSGLTVAAIPLLHLGGGLSFPLLLTLVALGSLFDSPGAAGRDSLLPDLAAAAGVAPERANSLYQAIPRLAILLGPALAGVLVALIGADQVLWVNAASFALSAGLVLALVPADRVAARAAGAARGLRGGLADMREGFRFIADDPLARWLLIMIGLLNLLDAPLGSVLLPTLAREELGGAGAFGLMLTTLGAGAVLSSLVFAAVGPRLPRRRTYLTSYLVLGLPYWVLATGPSLPLALAALFTMGLAAGPLNPILMTVRQERVPVALRGRVFGAMMAVSWVTIPLGQVMGGYAVQAFGTAAVFGVVAACYLLVTASMTLNPALRDMDRRPEAVPTRPERQARADLVG